MLTLNCSIFIVNAGGVSVSWLTVVPRQGL